MPLLRAGQYKQDPNIVIEYNHNTDTLVISGFGNITFYDTLPYFNTCKHVVFKGEVKCSMMSHLFANFTKLKDIKGTLDTSKCHDFSYAYAECHRLQNVIEGLDTFHGMEFDYMYSSCFSLTSIKMNSTEMGKKFKYMLYRCYSLKSVEGITVMTQDLEGWSKEHLEMCKLL